MQFIPIIIFWCSLILIFHVYFGYYAILYFASLFKREQRQKDESICPSVSLIISAYNEEKVIREKIENSLAIDYPKDRLEIIVVSDASTDDTDKIVLEYTGDNVLLHRQKERTGKTLGLNSVVPVTKGEILLFSDANALYNPDSVKKLVRNFADPEVGYVTGEARYVSENHSMAHKNENLYWAYEISLRKLENKVGSMIGADGAIYAIRRELFSPLKVDDINDFVNPIQIVLAGYKGIYEPEAVCYEDSAGKFSGEFRRKRRIVNRSMYGLLRLRQIMNPFRHGFYALQMISHKLIRWLIPFFLVVLFISNCTILSLHAVYFVFLLLQIAAYGLALLGLCKYRKKEEMKWLFSIPFYFCLVNLASALGIIDILRGKIITTWDTTRV